MNADERMLFFVAFAIAALLRGVVGGIAHLRDVHRRAACWQNGGIARLSGQVHDISQTYEPNRRNRP